MHSVTLVTLKHTMSRREKKKKLQTKSSEITGWKAGLWFAPVMLLTAMLYAGVGDFEFQMQWDDHEQVVNNEMVKNLSGQNLKKMFSGYVIGMYQPLSTLSFAVDHAIGGLDAGRYHSTNLILHLINVLLVWLLARKLFRRIDSATVMALLWAVHPMQVETVAWISTRSNLLFTVFFLGGLLTYLRYLKSTSKWDYALTVILMLLSCLSKSMAVTFPLALLAIDLLHNRRDWLKMGLEKAPMFALSLIFGIVAISYTEPGEIELDVQASLLERVMYIFYGLHFYIAQLVWPTGLSAAHYFPAGDSLPISYWLAPTTLVIAALPGILIRSIRREYFFGLLFFGVTIALVVLVPGRRTIVSERYVYLPYIGLMYAAIVLAMHFLKTSASKSAVHIPLLVVGAILAIPVAAITAQHKSVWKNSGTLFTDVIAKYPENYHGYAARGLYHLARKDAQPALKDLEAAIQRKPDFHEGHYNIGLIYANHLMQNEAALKAYTRAIDLHGEGSLYYAARATLLGRMHEYKQAEADFAKAIELNPENARAWENRGVIRTDQAMYELAIEDFNRSIELDSRNANTYISRGAAHSFLEQHEQAVADYTRAIELQPNNGQAHFNLGVSQFKMGKTQAACISWQKAKTLGDKNATGALKSYCNTPASN